MCTFASSQVCSHLKVARKQSCVEIKPECCVSVQGLHPSEEHFKANYVTTPLSGGCTATIRRGLTYPKILCTPEKEERMRENGDIAWSRSTLLRAWVAEMVT